ncbi:MAG TPA: TlpA disulfide reductase family protein [Bryobacteraceae bacterium]|nr:TlpA disulfide reductase family protein [Bryobacteraceae bacterium]
MWGRKPKTIVPPGEQAPAFELNTLAGGRESLQEILKSGPALLAFYKISCPVCQLTAPYLERLAASTEIQVVGISQDDSESTAGFNQRYGLTFPTLLDRSSESYPASNAYGISSVPTLFLVDAGGRVAKSFSGFSKRDIEELGERAGVAVFQAGDNVPEWKAG